MREKTTGSAAVAGRTDRAHTLTTSTRTEKRASRNGPRHSVYWVKPKASEPRTVTRASPGDMGGLAGQIVYTVLGKYTGDWRDGKKHGYGVFEFANGSKYEGEWVAGQRCGKGTFWVVDKKTHALRKQFAGDWVGEKRHGMGTFFGADGSRYDGEWVQNMREGAGRMLYGDSGTVYDGQWLANERSGHGALLLPNGDRYDGHWQHDKKEGPGRFFYKATHKVYEGEWVDDAPQCGTYHDNGHSAEHDDDPTEPHDRFELPELGLEHPERVVSESVASIRQERLIEAAIQAQQLGTSDNDHGDGGNGRGGAGRPSLQRSAVLFDDATMRLLQRAFQEIEQRDGTIACASLPHLLAVLGLTLEDDQIVGFLDEIGATPETPVSFAECVDIVSLLAESETEDGNDDDGGRDADEDDDQEEG